MDTIEVIPIPFVNTFDKACNRLKLDPPIYTNALEGSKFRFYVQIEVGRDAEGEKKYAKVRGSLSRDLGFAMQTAAENGLHRLKKSYRVDIHDINFDEKMTLKEELTQKDYEIDGLKYEIQLANYNQLCIKNVYLDIIKDLEAQIQVLKAKLPALGQETGEAAGQVESDPSEASSSENDLYD